MTFWEHLEELRSRIVRSLIAFFIACLAAWELREPMLAALVKPFAESWKSQHVPGEPTLHFNAPGAAFVAYMKLAMIGGVAMSTPILFYQLWSFVAPGLYAREKKFVSPFVTLSSALFCGGGYFGWRAAFPITFDYFLSLAGQVGSHHVTITPTVMMDEYIDFVVQMLLCFGIVFEIPLLILFLSMAGIVNYLQLIRFGRWYILIAFIIAAIATPPDVTSQLVMAIPMCLLYVLSIGLAYLFGKAPTPEDREEHRKWRRGEKAA